MCWRIEEGFCYEDWKDSVLFHISFSSSLAGEYSHGGDRGRRPWGETPSGFWCSTMSCLLTSFGWSKSHFSTWDKRTGFYTLLLRWRPALGLSAGRGKDFSLMNQPIHHKAPDMSLWRVAPVPDAVTSRYFSLWVRAGVRSQCPNTVFRRAFLACFCLLDSCLKS